MIDNLYEIYPGSSQIYPQRVNNGVIIMTSRTNSMSATNLELWYTSGTNASCFKLLNLGYGSKGTNFIDFFQIGSRLCFAANDGSVGIEFWETDGTIAGTTLIKDFIPGPGGLSTLNMARLLTQNKLFFSQTLANVGNEFCVTDGTNAGTIFLKDIYPGIGGSGISSITDAGNDNVYFLADNSVNGKELWKSDGTANGTTMVKDILTGANTSNISIHKIVNNILFFSANDGINGSELWRSDGTNAGTYLLKELTPGAAGSTISNFTTYNNKFVFSHNNVIWESDGTIAGTFSATNLPSSNSATVHSNFFEMNNSLYFFLDKIYGSTDSMFLYRMTNNVQNITFVKKLFASYHPQNKAIQITQETNGKFLFLVSGASIGVSDGTAAGTLISYNKIGHLYSMAYPYPGKSFTTGLPFLNNHWLCPMDLGGDDYELFKINHTTGVASLVKNINPNGPAMDHASLGWTFRYGTSGNKVYFLARDGVTGYELWETDGTGGGTNLTLDILPGNNVSSFVVPYSDDHESICIMNVDNRIYFYADTIQGGKVKLWTLDNQVGLQEFSLNATNTSIYPNPSKDFITLESENKVSTIEIKNLLGQSIKKVKVDGSTFKLPIQELSNGSYLLIISEPSGNVSTKKFIKME
ncbi:MAG TPA: T9SS type A sorting domain-containing protein [Bacteroidia bacterium]|nr:T9SS type A sorting domain-containing protein [Bacteroidia bacterium]